MSSLSRRVRGVATFHSCAYRYFRKHSGTPPWHPVHAAVINRKSDPHITSNAWFILEERIDTKTKKCSSLEFKGPGWLALLNDYFLASDETYNQAIKQMSGSHVFEKIFLISGSRSVAILYDKATQDR